MGKGKAKKFVLFGFNIAFLVSVCVDLCVESYGIFLDERGVIFAVLMPTMLRELEWYCQMFWKHLDPSVWHIVSVV